MELVANARMYSVTPAVSAAWRALFAWAAGEAGVPLAYLDHAAPAPLEDLWARDDLGAAFMCGFPFASAARKPALLAAPVPSPARYGGAPRYCTDLIVRADSRFARLRDTFGGRIGWTVGHSQSGYNAVRHHLLGQQGPQPLYTQWVGPLVTPRRVIDAVLDNTVDVGPLDSYVHDLLKRHDPETASKLRVVEFDRHDADPAACRFAGRRRRDDRAAAPRAAVLPRRTDDGCDARRAIDRAFRHRRRRRLSGHAVLGTAGRRRRDSGAAIEGSG